MQDICMLIALTEPMHLTGLALGHDNNSCVNSAELNDPIANATSEKTKTHKIAASQCTELSRTDCISELLLASET